MLTFFTVQPISSSILQVGHIVRPFSASIKQVLFQNILTYSLRCSGSSEISKNKMNTVLWDTLY